MSFSYVLIMLLNLAIAEIRVPGNHSRVWTYDDEKTWPGHRCQEGGARQSPIDVRSEDIVTDYQDTFIKHGPLKFAGFKRVLMTGINNGLTIQFSTDGERLIHPVLSGGPLAHSYRLEQVHFHWISEHAINGHKYYEKTWPGHRCQEGGARQSPIDVRSEDIVTDYQDTFIKHGPLKFAGFKRVLMTGINNGLTIQFSTDGERLIHPVLSGGPLAHSYRLEQVHFHWISEHAINGHKYPMEIHFVHVRSDLSVSEALRARDGLAIVALFCNVQSILTEEQEDQISEIMDFVPQLLNTGDRVSGVLLNLMKLIRPNTESYITYAGSLTSPECNEVVIWILFEAPIHISDSQYRLFGKIGLSRHNFRSLQPLRHHVVYKPKPDTIWQTPVIAQYFNEFVGTVSQFFKNITRFVRRRMMKLD